MLFLSFDLSELFCFITSLVMLQQGILTWNQKNPQREFITFSIATTAFIPAIVAVHVVPIVTYICWQKQHGGESFVKTKRKIYSGYQRLYTVLNQGTRIRQMLRNSYIPAHPTHLNSPHLCRRPSLEQTKWYFWHNKTEHTAMFSCKILYHIKT